MNVLLVESHELSANHHVLLRGRRAEHLRRVLGVEPGRQLKVGVLERDPREPGGIGAARVEAVDGERVLIALDPATLEQRPAPNVDLIVAMPRPKALRRILQTCAAFGLRSLQIVNAWRVPKSYFQSPFIQAEAIDEQLVLGNEQGGRYRVPKVTIFERLMDGLAPLSDCKRDKRIRLLAEPGQDAGLELLAPLDLDRPVLAALGPEGGFIQRELDTFSRLGFELLSLGDGILKSEVAVAVLLGQIELLRRIG